MALVYRAELIPRWVWVFLVVALLLLLVVALSLATTQDQRSGTALGEEVPTGNPADYIQRPAPEVPNVTPPAETVTPPATGTPAPAPSPQPAPGPTPQPGQPPDGLPASFTFGGQTYQYSTGPTHVNVLTTGQHAGDYIVYRRSGDKVPYQTLYLELTPNSNNFYAYTMQSG